MRFIKRFIILTTTLLLFTVSFAAAVSYQSLKAGSSGTEVKSLQNALKTLGYYQSSVDGKYGSSTRKAVITFQKANGLTADGIAGKATQKKLYALLESSSESSSSLKKGASGSRVRTLQTQLKALGYYKGSVDGKFGSSTVKAVKAFQKAKGLTQDGIAGAKTLALLEKQYTEQSSKQEEPEISSDDTLYYGCNGSEVKELQKQLKALGYYNSSLDGIFGKGTKEAVIAFQKANSMTADGLAGSKTRAAISKQYEALMAPDEPEKADTESGGSITGTLRRGSSGNEVKTLQTRLKELGYYTGSIDGSYGSSTVAAVTAFQSANSLSADGICGKATWNVMKSSSAIKCSSSATYTSTVVKTSGGIKLRLLHWFNDVKPSLSNGDHLQVYDPATGISWTLRVFSRGRHCDAEPLTAEDTANMNKAFGNITTWTPKPVYVKLPDGRWSLASTHNTPHESQSIKTNNFDGHLCVHFLRDMKEAATNDPNYGVQNQNTIRAKWKALTGETIQ